MNEKCEYSYFVKPAGWKIIEVNGEVEEERGHVIQISGPADRVIVACQSGSHFIPEHLGKYNPELGRIEPLEGDDWVIRCLSETARIQYESLLKPGSWTAEDNGGSGGGEEG